MAPKRNTVNSKLNNVAQRYLQFGENTQISHKNIFIKLLKPN